MAKLESRFEETLLDALLDDIEATLREEMLPRATEYSHKVLRRYGDANDYDVEGVIDSLQEPVVERESNRITARWGWDAEESLYFALGVDPHRIEGDPVLRFVWEDAPADIREQFSDTERVDGDPVVYLGSVDHPGIPRSDFVRAGLRQLERKVR
jgi:hypothetical protein